MDPAENLKIASKAGSTAPRPENGRTDSNQGRALGHRDLEVVVGDVPSGHRDALVDPHEVG